MRISFSKLVVFLGTPIVMMGFQNCAKLGTEDLLGGTSVFVADSSIDLTSVSPATESSDSSAQKLLAETKQTCSQVSSLDQNTVESCLNLFCQNPHQSGSGRRLCHALQLASAGFADLQ
ncbi:hypothetical protein [Bdellovibrio sp. HCB288]|uniref:hypothetical protein n=1 Tax=Bdellovibrio sp. HCB288 TaxID=3394355 RepID=UPI0039B3996E